MLVLEFEARKNVGLSYDTSYRLPRVIPVSVRPQQPTVFIVSDGAIVFLCKGWVRFEIKLANLIFAGASNW